MRHHRLETDCCQMRHRQEWGHHRQETDCSQMRRRRERGPHLQEMDCCQMRHRRDWEHHRQELGHHHLGLEHHHLRLERLQLGWGHHRQVGWRKHHQPEEEIPTRCQLKVRVRRRPLEQVECRRRNPQVSRSLRSHQQGAETPK